MLDDVPKECGQPVAGEMSGESRDESREKFGPNSDTVRVFYTAEERPRDRVRAVSVVRAVRGWAGACESHRYIK
jgi:hypothetical protein